MRILAVLTLMALTLCGCSETKVVVPDIPTPAASSSVSVTSDAAKVEVGDVEAKVDLELSMEGKNTRDLSAEELRNAKKKLNYLTISACAPRPAEVWIKITLKTVDSFPTRPTAVRGRLYREITKGHPEEISTFQTVLDAFSAPNRRKEGGKYNPIEFRADILQGLASLPETMLIYAEAEVFMSPTGTDATAIDPATYTTGPEDTGSLLSNPIRFNFNPVPALPPHAEVPTLESVLKNPLGTPVAPDGAAAAAAPAEPASAPASESTAPEAAVAPAAETTPADAPETPANTAPATKAVGAAQ